MLISKLLSIVANSTAEAETIAAAMATKSGLWVRKLLGKILHPELESGQPTSSLSRL
jgi:hypothetical protein